MRTPRATLPLATLALLLAGCEREQRRFQELPGGSPPSTGVQQSTLQPGQPLARPGPPGGAYQENAYAISQGKQLYTWMNCVGCHAHGGGGMGPPLMDAEWRYGSDPQNIYHTILEGRPNGMPSYRNKLNDQQLWQLVAYVRSMSGLVPMDAVNSRADDLQYKKPENIQDQQHEERPVTEPAEHVR